MARSEMGHRSDEITSYLSDALEPEARAALEAHLDTCEECQREVKAQRELFNRTNELLAFKGKRTIDAQVARFEREVAAERATARGRAPAPRHRRRWAIPVVLALAASAAAVFLLVGKPGGVGLNAIAHQTVEDAGEELHVMGSPHRPTPPPDGGVDGGTTKAR